MVIHLLLVVAASVVAVWPPVVLDPLEGECGENSLSRLHTAKTAEYPQRDLCYMEQRQYYCYYWSSEISGDNPKSLLGDAAKPSLSTLLH